MKLHFPHGEISDQTISDGLIDIGSSDDADIVIKDKGLADVHATLHVNGTEMHISINSEARLVSVNGKLVKGQKEVRPGDLVIISQVHMKVLESQSEEKDDNRTRIRMALPKFVLRGVSGAYFGKTFPLRGVTVMGRHSECHICLNSEGISRKHAQITVDSDGLTIKDLDSSNGTYVNGEKIEELLLKVGDEVKLDDLRFLIQTPGMSGPEEKKQVEVDDELKKENVSHAIEDEPTGSSLLKWLLALTILGGAGFAVWKLGYLNGLLG